MGAKPGVRRVPAHLTDTCSNGRPGSGFDSKHVACAQESVIPRNANGKLLDRHNRGTAETVSVVTANAVLRNFMQYLMIVFTFLYRNACNTLIGCGL